MADEMNTDERAKFEAALPSTIAEAFRRDFCPYKGAPDPWVVWQAAWQSALRASHGQAPAGATAWQLSPLVWTEPSEPTEHIRYNHVTAETALGRFSIEWKGWKEHDSMCLYLGGDYVDTAQDLDSAKQLAKDYLQKIAGALAAPEAIASLGTAWKAMAAMKE